MVGRGDLLQVWPEVQRATPSACRRVELPIADRNGGEARCAWHARDLPAVNVCPH
eukprot:CAMPEP_0171099506 /NCGR_PEP_ID=MMETSP0766_2-20121228/51743_1 /TAXON_ID=439317 /ORGANISM="Gambierdiscus australes, Strain CAWD 149" /LENGTH=54 /DNA_ID=CAMNT_0011559149 /DNA_START=73 /DNA_END=237 /DNA_ORIENTATION=-